MAGLSRIYQLLDDAGAPACAKAFVLAVYKARSKGTRIKMSPEAFANSTDARHARDLGIVRQLENRAVIFTRRGEDLIQ